MTLAAGLDIAIKLAKAVAALHRAGIVHRDIKPENVILQPDGGLKLIDLGVARLPQLEDTRTVEFAGHAQLHGAGAVRRRQADEASDLFALGVTVYRVFAGAPIPYGEIEAFSQPRFSPPDAAQPSIGPTCPRGSITSWLAPSPSIARARFADAVEFAFELEHGSLRAVPCSVARQLHCTSAIRPASGK